MPFVIAIVLGLAFLLWRSWARDRVEGAVGRRMDTWVARVFGRNRCRWTGMGKGAGSLQEFRCETCGVTAFSQSQAGPRECKRGLKGGL
jgi:hypothetical protein